MLGVSAERSVGFNNLGVPHEIKRKCGHNHSRPNFNVYRNELESLFKKSGDALGYSTLPVVTPTASLTIP